MSDHLQDGDLDSRSHSALAILIVRLAGAPGDRHRIMLDQVARKAEAVAEHQLIALHKVLAIAYGGDLSFGIATMPGYSFSNLCGNCAL